MKIEDKQFNHGAALMQIAEHESFTAINPLVLNGERSHTAFVINHDIAIYPKYASAPKNSHEEYLFNFSAANIEELMAIGGQYGRTVLTLVCVNGREICGLTFDQFCELRSRRVRDVGYAEDPFSLLVTLPKGQQFRVYVNASGVKNKTLGSPILVPRKAYPNMLFDASFMARPKRASVKV